jgi:phosphatidylinositol alpha-1,6-mannosyltransferase
MTHSLRWVYSILYAQALKKIDRIVAVSTYTKNYLLKCLQNDGISYDASKIEVIHNAIRVADYPYELEHESIGPKRILTVAPVKARKGLMESIHAVAAYHKKYSIDFVYRIVGGYDPENALAKELQAEIDRLAIREMVTFTGRVSDDELKKEYASADLFLMLPVVKEPYFEGFGLVYLEAAAAGVPSIGSKEGGSSEAIQEGVSGFLVDAEDADVAAERIHGVLSKDMITHAGARAWAEEHDINKLAEEVRSLYRKLLL